MSQQQIKEGITVLNYYMAQRGNRMYGGTNFWTHQTFVWKLWNPSSFQISKMEAFLGKWKMDYDACEGYDEFMTAEVNKIVIKCKTRLTQYTHGHTILQQQSNQVINQQQPTHP